MYNDVMDYDMLYVRSRIISSVRSFFDEHGFLETLTPALSPNLIPECSLEVFKTLLSPPRGAARGGAIPYYLTPSPEIWMKKLIAMHKKSIYQVCSSFRNCEPSSPLHNNEFTMLEYYAMDAGYKDVLALTEELFDYLICKNKKNLLRFLGEAELKQAAPPFIRITMEEAFMRYAGFSLKNAIEKKELKKEALRLGLNIDEGVKDADVYNLIFIHAVESALPKEKPVALIDYPAIVKTLAALAPQSGGVFCERWELYVRGVEAVNCYSEETSPIAARRYFEEEGAEKQRTAVVPHKIDPDYWRIFEGFPRCSGAAAGLDRIIAAFTGKKSIKAALPFPMPMEEF
ncbi:MAG: LysR family transcriptional regulator [Spirochaetaceae bacterium]|jgi:lysyl-tRNA synthetase class 2|nr:LysR family transcriptional regulator [Spirochaetaceae bacterium]